VARVEIPVTDVAPPKASLTTALTGTHNDLVYTARTGGPWGNSIQVEYLVAGANTPLTIVVSGFLITVNVATDGGSAAASTAAEIAAAVAANSDSALLVTIANAAANDGSGVVTALSATALSGGALGITPPSATNGDSTNDNFFTGNDGQIELEVVSSDASPQTVTVHYSPNLNQGVVTAPHVEAVAAGATKRMGPFSMGLFNQNQARDVYVDPSVSTTLKFRAYRVAKL
jgi:hypothetical protein